LVLFASQTADPWSARLEMDQQAEEKQVAPNEDRGNDHAEARNGGNASVAANKGPTDGVADHERMATVEERPHAPATSIVYAPLAKTKLPATRLQHPKLGSLPGWLNDDQQSVASTRRSHRSRVAESVASTKRSRIAESMVSVATQSTARARELAVQRKELQRKTDDALKKQKKAADAKSKILEQEKYQAYEIGLHEWEKVQVLADEDTLSPLHSDMFEKPKRPIVPRLVAATSQITSARLWSFTPRPIGTPRGGFILSSARYMETSRSEKEEKRQRKIVERALKNVKVANDRVQAEHKKLRHAAVVASGKAYMTQQASYRQRQLETKEHSKQLRNEQTETVRQDAEVRKRNEQAAALERRKNAEDRQSKPLRSWNTNKKKNKRSRRHKHATPKLAHARKPPQSARPKRFRKTSSSSDVARRHRPRGSRKPKPSEKQTGSFNHEERSGKQTMKRQRKMQQRRRKLQK
jgi:hypothetical protein